MKDFHLLPSSPDIQNLTSDQLSFILANYKRDSLELQRKSGKGQDDNNEWWYQDEKEFEPIVEGHDEQDLARQAQRLFEKVNGENSLSDVDKHIAMRLKELQDESAELEKQNAPKGVNNLAQLEERKAFDKLGSGASTDSINRQIVEFEDDDEYI